MSQETIEAVRGVRIPLISETRRHRTLDERIIVRFPALASWLGAMWARLPRHSRMRRGVLVRRIRQAYAAANRRDLDFLLTGLDPGIEYHADEPWRLGFDAVYHGHDGYLQVWRGMLESFEDMRLDPEELLDFGDRFLITITVSGHGAGSGVSVSQPIFQLFTQRRGSVIRQDDFQDRAQAFEAVGRLEQDAPAGS